MGRLLTVVLLTLLLGFTGLSAGPDAKSVVVVANRADPDSGRLAAYYMERRSIPAENLIEIETSRSETIEWREFTETIFNPLLAELVGKGWIDAVESDLKDNYGKSRYAVAGHKLGYLVVCKGVPLRIRNADGLIPEEMRGRTPKQFLTNRGAVDAELSMLAQPHYEITGFVRNPFFSNGRASSIEENAVVKVSRLDGPTLSTAKSLVDSALAAEKHGLLGRAYIDKAKKHPRGDLWLDSAAKLLEPTGYPVVVDSVPRRFQATDRFDAPAFYFGWYSGSIDGVFLAPGFRFPPGAIALHIHSYSAPTLRDANRGWCAGFVARGVAATFGNVGEPFLDFTHRPDLLVKALLEGKNLGDAAYYALPVLSWQPVMLGDPLYRPFKVTPEKQIDMPREEASVYGQYAYIRKMRLAEAAGEYDEAIRLGRQGMRASPGLAVALELSNALRNQGRYVEASRLLEFAEFLTSFTSDDWIVAKEVADRMAENGDEKGGLLVYKNLINSRGLPRDVLNLLLRDGEELARRAGDSRIAREWKGRREKS